MEGAQPVARASPGWPLSQRESKKNPQNPLYHLQKENQRKGKDGERRRKKGKREDEGMEEYRVNSPSEIPQQAFSRTRRQTEIKSLYKTVRLGG